MELGGGAEANWEFEVASQHFRGKVQVHESSSEVPRYTYKTGKYPLISHSEDLR